MTVTGMNALTGRWLTGEAHLHQSVHDILLTPQGTRVMRRDYGSLLPALLDLPQNAATRLKIMSAAYLALWRWEPRLTLWQVDVSQTAEGSWQITLRGQVAGQTAPFSAAVTTGGHDADY